MMNRGVYNKRWKYWTKGQSENIHQCKVSGLREKLNKRKSENRREDYQTVNKEEYLNRNPFKTKGSPFWLVPNSL